MNQISSITIIENNKETAERAAIQLEKANVLLGDAVEPRDNTRG